MKRARPKLELLEDRSLLATLLWNPLPGGMNLNWSAPGSWIVLDAGPNQGQRAMFAPKAGDNLVFSQASSISSTDDILLGANQSFASVKITAGFTGTITLNDPLSVQTFVFASNATITGAADDANFTLLGQGTWSEGTMSGLGKVLVAPSATLTLSGSDAQTDPTLISKTMVVESGAGRGITSKLSEANFQVQMLSGILFLNGKSSVEDDGSFLVKGTQNILIGGFNTSTLADFKVQPGGLLRVNMPSKTSLHMNVRFEDSSAASATQVIVASGDMSLYAGGSISGIVMLAGSATMTFDQSGQDTQYDWQSGTQFVGAGTVRVKGEGAGADEGTTRFDAIINVEAAEVDFGTTVKFDAWGGALVGPGALRFKGGTTYLDGFLVWAADENGTNAAHIIVDAKATVVFRGAQDAGGNYLSPAILRGAHVDVTGTLEFAGQVFTGWDAYGMPLVTELTDADPLSMYMGNNAQVSFNKGSSLVLVDAVYVAPYDTQPSTAPKLLLQNGAMLVKMATGIRTTSTIGPGIYLPGFDAHRQIVYQANAGLLNVFWQMTVDGPQQSVSITDPLGGRQLGFKFLGPLDTSTPVVNAQGGSTWTGSAMITTNDVINAGALIPGGSGRLGALDFNGDLNLKSTSSVAIDVFGPSVSNNYDQVLATGFSTLGGTLKVSFGGYVPKPGDTYDVLLLSGGYTGTFGTVALPSFPGERLQVNYDQTDVSITVVAVPTKPTITRVASNTGSTTGGESVIITGTGFRGVQSITFGGVAALDWTVNSSTQITAVVPGHLAGAVTLQIITGGGVAKATFTYTNGPIPAITGLETTSGYLAGGNTILIDGSGFTGATDVTFGTISATSFKVVSDTQISAVVPAFASPGIVDVHVKAASGASATVAADKYTYVMQPAPSVTGLSVSNGTDAGGTSVTITGTGFVNVYDVQFVGPTGGESAASFRINSPTSITVVTPRDVPGTVDIHVVTLGGSSPTTGADQFNFYLATNPAITGVSPNQGYTVGGTVVTITGVHFTGVTSVVFGGVAARTFTINSDGSITATAPPVTAGGPVDITVSTATASSAHTAADKFTYVVPPVPVVTGLSTSSGPTAGGTVVTVLGSGFTTTTGVSFGGVAATKFTVLSDTALLVTTPADSPGAVDVQVTDVSGTSSATAADEFTFVAPQPVVLAVTPDSGSTTGGNTITVLGTGFTGATAVDFNGVPVPAGNFAVNNDNSITVITPAAAAGTDDITVTTSGGTSATSSQDQFTFIKPPAPAVTGLSTNQGTTSGGTVVVITGTNFTGATAVDFGAGNAATSFTINSDTQITAMAPAEGPGTVDVTVTTAEGTSGANQSDQFTFQSVVPTVAGISPAAGSVSGGNSITITGTGFLGATGVEFGTTAAQSFTIQSDTTLVAVVPAESSGTVDVTVATSAGTSNTSSADKYAFDSTPVVSFLSPFSDTATGGVPITITGSGFTTATQVDFGSTVITSFKINSDTSITVTAPAHTVGNVNLTVVGPGGESNTEQFSFTTANTVTWIGGNGSWGTASDWSGGQLPGASDDVIITSGVTVTHDTGNDTIHQLTVNGTLDLTGGTLDVAATGTLASLSVTGGTLDGTGALTVTGNFTWGGGTLSSSSGLTVDGNSSLAGNLTLSGTVINDGAATWTGDGTLQFTGGTWVDNGSNSSFVADSNGSLETISGTGTFVNDGGTFDKQGLEPLDIGTGVSFDNTGTVTIDGGTLTLSDGSNSGTIDVNSGTQLTFSDNFTLTSTSTIDGTGTIDVSSGSLDLGGTLSGATLTIEQGASANGSATINAAVINNGTISDGGTIGTLTINGNFTQSSSGTLNLALGSATAYDQLKIAGMAVLGGTLNVTTTNSYMPPHNTTFTLLTYDSFSGSFGTINTSFGPATETVTPTNFNLVAMISETTPSADTSDSQPEMRSTIPAADDDRAAMMLASLMPEEQDGPNEVVLASAGDGNSYGRGMDDAVWQDVMSFEEMLSLPLRMVEAVVEAVV
jgi:hypothetical protein